MKSKLNRLYCLVRLRAARLLRNKESILESEHLPSILLVQATFWVWILLIVVLLIVLIKYSKCLSPEKVEKEYVSGTASKVDCKSCGMPNRRA